MYGDLILRRQQGSPLGLAKTQITAEQYVGSQV